MNFANLSSVADERHNGVKLPVLLKIFNKQEFVSMFEECLLLSFNVNEIAT